MNVSWLKRYLFCIAMAVGCSPAAMAQIQGSFFEGMDLSTPAELGSDIARIQTDLAWLGLYLDPIDGRQSSATTAAIRLFQQGLSASATGALSSDERGILRQRARQTREGYGFERHQIEWLGIGANLPMSIMGLPSLSGNELQYVNYKTLHSSNMFIDFAAFDFRASGQDILRFTLESFQESDPDTKVLNSAATNSSFYGSYIHFGKRVLMIGQFQNQWRRIQLRYDANDHDAMRPILNEILHSLDFFAGRGVPKSERRSSLQAGRYPGADQTPSWYRSMIANGSGSLVSRNGHVLTNHHVISGCQRVTVNGTEAQVIGSDVRLDLALIEAPAIKGRRPIRFRSDNPQLGERVAVLGYPVFGVSQSLNFTSGFISSAVGFLGDRTRVQVTAPIQPGNSGGPVVDTNGTQVAVVSSKAKIENVDNVGWVIRGRQAVRFLERFGVRPSMESREPQENMPASDTIQDWRQFALRIECHSN